MLAQNLLRVKVVRNSRKLICVENWTYCKTNVYYLYIGGESGVPLKLQFDIQDPKSPSVVPLYSAGCQIKVFRVGKFLHS